MFRRLSIVPYGRMQFVDVTAGPMERLFGLATVDVIVGVSAPVAGTVKIWGLVVWLIGLTAVIFLWQRASTAFFNGTRSS